MRTQLFALLVCGAALAAPAPYVASAPPAERQEINKTFELSPGATVEVSSISGPVDVEVVDSRTAEVHVVRSAPSQAELDCVPMVVEGSPDRLVVRVLQGHGPGCRNVRRSEHVTLRIPASVNFRASSVSGNVTVGRLDGTVRLSSISGSARVGAVSGELEVSSISGNVEVDRATGSVSVSSVSGSVAVAIAELGDRGVRVTSVSGDVELRFSGGADAEVKVDSISGGVESELPGMTVTKTGDSSFRGRIGAGRIPITISSISGDVRFTGL